MARNQEYLEQYLQCATNMAHEGKRPEDVVLILENAKQYAKQYGLAVPDEKIEVIRTNAYQEAVSYHFRLAYDLLKEGHKDLGRTAFSRLLRYSSILKSDIRDKVIILEELLRK